MQEATDEALRKELAKHERAVLPGFYGSNAEDGKVRTFSRGGSDITGSLVARAVDADIYENWTDEKLPEVHRVVRPDFCWRLRQK